MIKKALLIAGIATIVSIGACVGYAEEIQVPNEEVLYYNSFPTGTNQDLPEVENDRFYFYGYNVNLKKAMNIDREYAHDKVNCTAVEYNWNVQLYNLGPYVYNGNTGICLTDPNQSCVSGPIVMFDFRYKNAQKDPSINPNGLYTGVYKLSFNFINRTGESNEEGPRVQANCYHGNDGNNFALIKRGKWHVLNGPVWGFVESDIPITDGELHTYEIIFDYDNEMVHTYMDGVKRKSIYNFNTPIKFLHITMSGACQYLDDVLLTKMQSNRDMSITDFKYDAQGAVVEFSDYIADFSELSGTIEDVYTGNTINCTVAAQSGKSLRIKPKNALVEGHEYVLSINGEVLGIGGNSVNAEENQWFNFAKTGSVKSMNIVDYSGGRQRYSKNPAAEIDGFEFEFTEDVNASNALCGLQLTDAEDKSVPYTIEPGDVQNKAIVRLTGSLSGESTYKMQLSGLKSSYTWQFTTKDGRISLKPIKLYKADGTTPVSLSELSEGETVKAEITVVNTKSNPEEVSVMLSAGLYSDKHLDDYDFESVKIEAGATVFTKTVEFTVKRAEDLQIKAFGWEKLGSRSPLMPAVVLK